MISIDGELRLSEWNVSVCCPKHVVWRLRPAGHGDILTVPSCSHQRLEKPPIKLFKFGQYRSVADRSERPCFLEPRTGSL